MLLDLLTLSSFSTGALRMKDQKQTDQSLCLSLIHLLILLMTFAFVAGVVSGVGFQWGGYHNSHAHAGVPDSANQDGPADGAYTVHRPEHWAFAHTGLAQGETFGADHVRESGACRDCSCSGFAV